MLIKYSNAEFVKVIEDDEHSLDDKGTRKALAQAKKEKEMRAKGKNIEEN